MRLKGIDARNITTTPVVSRPRRQVNTVFGDNLDEMHIKDNLLRGADVARVGDDADEENAEEEGRQLDEESDLEGGDGEENNQVDGPGDTRPEHANADAVDAVNGPNMAAPNAAILDIAAPEAAAPDVAVAALGGHLLGDNPDVVAITENLLHGADAALECFIKDCKS